MSILVGKQSRLIIQGITGSAAALHARLIQAYGTPLVGGVAPGKGGESRLGLPVFDTVREAVQATRADISLIIMPADRVRDAILEAAYGGIKTLVSITEGIRVHDMLVIKRCLHETGARLIGPNCPGLITPGEAKVGIMPERAFRPGRIGVISRSGTLGYEVAMQLCEGGFGQSTFVGIGGDPLKGTSYRDLLPLFEADPGTDAVVITGEIGGAEEEAAAEYISRSMRKPVVAFIAGKGAPPERRMGHAGAIISGNHGSYASKAAALTAAGVALAEAPSEVPVLLKKLWQRTGGTA